MVISAMSAWHAFSTGRYLEIYRVVLVCFSFKSVSIWCTSFTGLTGKLHLINATEKASTTVHFFIRLYIPQSVPVVILAYRFLTLVFLIAATSLAIEASKSNSSSSSLSAPLSAPSSSLGYNSSPYYQYVKRKSIPCKIMPNQLTFILWLGYPMPLWWREILYPEYT